MTIGEWREITQIVYYIALSVTGPLALIGFIQAKRKEQQQREEGTYHTLDEKYLDYQKLCLRYAELDTFDYAMPSPPALTETDKKRELVMFTILISIMERAFLMYRGHSVEVRQKQWLGRVDYIDSFCKRPNFRRAWETCGEMFDSDFQAFVAARLRSA